MTAKVSRKLFLFGKYSLALLLPKKWLTEAGVEIGDTVDLEYRAKKGKIAVIFRTTKKPVASSQTKSATESLEDGSDWEPIPQI